MAYKYAVVGAGMQGTAAAYDLLTHGEGETVLLLDGDERKARDAAERINRLCGGGAEYRVVDAAREDELVAALGGIDGIFSGVPYALNPGVARAALSVGACMCDLGGNTAYVREVLGLAAAARDRGISLLPDCGLAPGLGNQLSALGLERMPDARHVHVRCGGLPQEPKPPLGYKQVFSLGGLTNEYTGMADAIREGEKVSIPAFTELESLEFPAPLGRLEGFVTSGGTSTCPDTWAGRLTTLDYKTLRYPGHYEKFRLLIDLGLLDLDSVRIGDTEIVPRDVLHACLAPRLAFPGDRDLVVLRVTVLNASRSNKLQFDLLDRHDETTGFSAMERCTAYPAAATLHLQVRGDVEPGAWPPEAGAPPEVLYRAVLERGLAVEIS